jgi:UDP-N-acetylglucosamine diphosphorylase/glucosamine-1-phosphate N-acetyltransferase
MNIVLIDEEQNWKNLLPFCFTRPVSEIRIGILTLREKWELLLNARCSYFTQSYLSEKYAYTPQADQIFIASNVCGDRRLAKAIKGLQEGQALVQQDTLLAARCSLESFQTGSGLTKVSFPHPVLRVQHVYDIFQKNAEALKQDFDLVCEGRASQPLSKSVTVIGDPSLIFLEKGAVAEACVLNTNGGPIYLGPEAEIMEGALVRGPFALCEHSTLKLGAKVYGASTVGPHSKVGGELSNSVIFGYSNKAHDGFLGNSVLGEWCNLGADTNNSNLKNNYGPVKLYNYAAGKLVNTGLQFCGLMMGDHSKAGINTMFNTGTVVGVGCNIYGGGFPATHISNFSWGGAEGFENYQLQKLIETATKMYERRDLVLTESDLRILKHLAAEAL